MRNKLENTCARIHDIPMEQPIKISLGFFEGGFGFVGFVCLLLFGDVTQYFTFCTTEAIISTGLKV